MWAGEKEMAELVNFDNEVSEFDAVEEKASELPEQKPESVLDDLATVLNFYLI